MIRLNLIDAAERESLMDNVNPVHVTDVGSQGKASKKKILTIVLSVLFVLVAFCCFLSICGVPKPLQGMIPGQFLDIIGADDPSRTALTLGAGQTTSAGGSLEAQAAAAEAAIKHRADLTVKQVVGEVNPTVLYNNKRTDYTQFLPMEKISYQRAALSQFFAFLSTATPDDVGFSDCAFYAPNYFYVRGVAVKPTSQRSFLDRIKNMSSDFKTPPLPENAPATDITAFGKFNVNNVNLASVTAFVRSAELDEEIKAFKTLAATNKVVLKGLEKPVVEDFGVYKRYSFQVTSGNDFPELQTLFAAIAASPIRIGVEKVDMKFAKKNNMFTSMRLVMYVTP